MRSWHWLSARAPTRGNRTRANRAALAKTKARTRRQTTWDTSDRPTLARSRRGRRRESEFAVAKNCAVFGLCEKFAALVNHSEAFRRPSLGVVLPPISRDHAYRDDKANQRDDRQDYIAVVHRNLPVARGPKLVEKALLRMNGVERITKAHQRSCLSWGQKPFALPSRAREEGTSGRGIWPTSTAWKVAGLPDGERLGAACCEVLAVLLPLCFQSPVSGDRDRN